MVGTEGQDIGNFARVKKRCVESSLGEREKYLVAMLLTVRPVCEAD